MLNSIGAYKVQKRTTPSLTLIGTPQFTNCSSIGFAGGQNGFTTRVTVTALGLYRAWDAQWSADAEIV